MSDNNTHILLFDGVCNLCNGVVKFIIKNDKKGKFKFAALQSDSARRLLNKFGIAANDIESFVYINEGHSYRRSTAVLHVLLEIGGVWKLFYVFIIIPGFIRDFFYSIIAKTRYRIFGKRATCMVPTNDIIERFLP